MDSNTLGSVYPDAIRDEEQPDGSATTVLRLTRRASLIVVLLLSLGLWAAIWAAVASLASAILG
jgi:hypothetical protein